MMDSSSVMVRMENLADNSDAQVPANEQKDQ